MEKKKVKVLNLKTQIGKEIWALNVGKIVIYCVQFSPQNP